MRISYGAGDALRHARAQRPDIVFLDAVDSERVATEMARQLRSEPKLQRVIIVALSSRPLPEGARRTNRATIDYWLSSPPDAEFVKKLLGRQR